MGRSKLSPISQPNDFTCGPASLKIASKILNRRISLKSASLLCRTDHCGTSTDDLIRAARSLGFYVLHLEGANLKHLQACLRSTNTKPKAAIVSYLYDDRIPDSPNENSSHFAVVASYLSRSGRIQLFDSYTGKKTSSSWLKFIKLWYETGLKRRKIAKGSLRYRMIKVKTKRMLIVLARKQEFLPKFTSSVVKLYSPSKHHLQRAQNNRSAQKRSLAKSASSQTVIPSII